MNAGLLFFAFINSLFALNIYFDVREIKRDIKRLLDGEDKP